MRIVCLPLIGLLIAGALPARAASSTALSQSQALNKVFGVLKTWGSERDEAKNVKSLINDRSQWTKELQAAGDLADGAMAYLNGLDVGAKVIGWKFSIGTPSGQSLSRSIDSGNGQLARFGLDRPGHGWTAEAVLGLRQGRFNNDALNFKYTLKFD